jgi:hypothetical protein
MDNPQRSSKGDRAAPEGTPENLPAPDPSVHQDDTPVGGEVGQPGGRTDQPGTGRPELRLVPKPEVPECQGAKPKPRRPRHEVPSLASVVERQHRQLRNQVALIADGTEVALVIYGPGGTGKSYVVDDELTEQRRRRRINVTWFGGGKFTPLAFYETLYLHRAYGDIVVAEDMETLLRDDDVQSILRGALFGKEDPRTKVMHRELHWHSNSRALEKKNIPQSFHYEGSLIVIVNDLPRTSPIWSGVFSRVVPMYVGFEQEELIAFVKKLVIEGNGKTVRVSNVLTHLSVDDCLTVINYLSTKKPVDLRDLDRSLRAFCAYRQHDAWKGMIDSNFAGKQAMAASTTSADHVFEALEERSDLKIKERAAEFVKQTGMSTRTYHRMRDERGLARGYRGRRGRR